MDCKPKWNSWVILIVNSVIVLAAMLFVHFCWYGLKDVSAYSRSWSEIGATAIFSIAYAYLFNKVTYHWRTDFAFGIFNRISGASHECGWKSGTNFFNALFLGCLVMVMVFAMMAMAGVFMTTFFVFVMDGIRGAVPPPDETTVDAAAMAAQIGGATVAVELFGKTEGTPRRPL